MSMLATLTSYDDDGVLLDPVLGRWLGLTPEQPAHFLRGFPECPRAAPSRVGDPPRATGRARAAGWAHRAPSAAGLRN